MKQKRLPSLEEVFRAMASYYGPIHWWPAKTSFEVMVGAVLTQNTAWTNVEKAIRNLRRHRLLTIRALDSIEEARLAPLIRSSGYFNQKARKLKALTRFIMEQYGGSIARMRKSDPALVREQLLSVKGIGPETADSIVLYALDRPIFVVDAYTKRILERHYMLRKGLTYEAVQEYFHSRLPRDTALYNEFHGLLVYIAKDFCRSRPRCSTCPLNAFPHV